MRVGGKLSINVIGNYFPLVFPSEQEEKTGITKISKIFDTVSGGASALAGTDFRREKQRVRLVCTGVRFSGIFKNSAPLTISFVYN